MEFRKKPVVIDAITFDELVQHGRDNGGNIVNGMPWSFTYKGHAITHENDQRYIIPTLEGSHHMTPLDMLITGVKGEIYPCKLDIFQATYDKVQQTNEASIEQSIVAKGLIAPRITPADLTANIVDTEIVKHVSKTGQVLRWAVLTTQNGYAVVGKPSVAVSPENDSAELGAQIAVENSRNDLWSLMGYALKQKLYDRGQQLTKTTSAN